GARPIAVLNSLRFGELTSPRVKYLFVKSYFRYVLNEYGRGKIRSILFSEGVTIYDRHFCVSYRHHHGVVLSSSW
ncbi:hypothetical protein VSS76_18200, partial [Bacillus safensis]